MTDHELLQAYVTKGSQAAFTELVNRHLPLVWSAARRQVRDEHLTQDVAQQVFTLLACKAPELTSETVVPGWLYRTTSHVAARAQRGESRRREREEFAITAMNETPTETAWMEVEPLLDEAMASLNDTDRDAVILRYFKNQSLREVGTALGSSEDAAQKRLTRAVEKLHSFFIRRGKTVTTGTFLAALAGTAVQPVPAGIWGTLPDLPSTGEPFTVGGMTKTELQDECNALDVKLRNARVADAEASKDLKRFNEQNEAWDRFVTAALSQGRSLFGPDTPERAVIDAIPTAPSTQPPEQAEIDLAENPDSGTVRLEFSAEHATSFKVFHKGPGDAAFTEVADVLLPGEYSAVGLTAGTHDYKIVGVNSRGEGPASEIASIDVAVAAAA